MQQSILTRFFVNSKDIRRSSVIWNMVSSTLFSCQSAFMLIIITRTCGQADAGVFSISYAVASMMAYIGEYSVRKYQASDINEECKFADYRAFRVITCSVMMLVSVGYALRGVISIGYTWEKFAVMVLICLDLMIYALHELYYGRLQQLHRLDIGSKTTSFRTALGMLVFIIALIVTRNLLISVAVWAAGTFLGFLISTVSVYPECRISQDERHDWKRVRKIAVDCFPLFLGMFLLMYIGNAPKYAIDAHLTDELQAKYTYIFMPVFVIGLMANFIFNPILVDLADSWENRDYHKFFSMIRKNVFVIAGLTLLAIAVALTIGCPVLGILYNTDLSDVKAELVILMIGGGMLAMTNFITVVTTIIRAQKHLMIGYFTVAVLALLFAGSFVMKYAIMGAAVLYTVLLSALTLLFTIILTVCIRNRMAKDKTGEI